MALSINAEIRNGSTNPQESIGVNGLSVAPTGTHEQAGRIDVGTSEESFAISADIATNGYALFVNRDATNFVQVGYVTGVYFAKIPAGGVMLIPLDPSVATIFTKADTAAVQLQYKIYEA